MVDTATLRAYSSEEIQDQLVEYLIFMVDYWIYTNHVGFMFSSLKDKLEGLMHSIHVTLAGNAGGFDASVDMRVFSTQEQVDNAVEGSHNYLPSGLANAVDINDGSLQYHSAGYHQLEPESDPESLREWDADEMRIMYQNEVASLLDNVLQMDTSEIEKGYAFLRAYLNLFENGFNDHKGFITLFAVSIEEDREFFIEEGENYYEDETQISGIERSLVTVFDELSPDTIA